jgi:uncharacterized protein (DUF302 family)
MGYRSDIQLQAQLVQFDTQLPYDDVIARLQSQMINKDVSTQIITRFREARTQEDVEEIVGDTTRGLDFLYVRVYQFGSRFSPMFLPNRYFGEFKHHKLLDIYRGVDDTPKAVVYTIGNPLIAQTILRHDIRAALEIPPRLLILEKPDRKGTQILYHLPSSVMTLDGNPELVSAVEALDVKLEKLVSTITAFE